MQGQKGLFRCQDPRVGQPGSHVDLPAMQLRQAMNPAHLAPPFLFDESDQYGRIPPVTRNRKDVSREAAAIWLFGCCGPRGILA